MNPTHGITLLQSLLLAEESPACSLQPSSCPSLPPTVVLDYVDQILTEWASVYQVFFIVKTVGWADMTATSDGDQR